LKTNNYQHLGTLGTGNHFIEVCLDEQQRVWVMLHSGSRGVGNAIGTLFITLAQQDMQQHIANLPDKNLAYFKEGVSTMTTIWKPCRGQDFARHNREVMMSRVLAALSRIVTKPFMTQQEAVNCHHNYVQKETHFGEEVLVTRKGAVSAQKVRWGLFPVRWGRKALSYVDWEMKRASALVATAQGAR
jgi:tRNA-splicing ligase RtcB